MSKCINALSAYQPTRAPARQSADEFGTALKLYILETEAIETRRMRFRQVGLVMAMVVCLLVSHWPAAISTTNAVAGVVTEASMSAAMPGVATQRLAFAGGMLVH